MFGQQTVQYGCDDMKSLLRVKLKILLFGENHEDRLGRTSGTVHTVDGFSWVVWIPCTTTTTVTYIR